MRILLCNDDGYRAIGIQTLARHLRQGGHEVLIVAPSEERSGQSHAMTFFRPIVTHRIDEQTWSVEGTPADCAALALHHFLRDRQPDLVVSGINHGMNVGWDVNYSGTVGAATEAGLLGHRAIAVSVDLDFRRPALEQGERFDRAANLLCQIIARLDHAVWPTGQILNVNHPGIIAKGMVQANCAGYNMHEPEITQRAPGVFTMGGSKRIDRGDPSEDVSRVQSGYATLSFLLARQSSPAVSPDWAELIEGLEFV
jgi:5'-nucleotidase